MLIIEIGDGYLRIDNSFFRGDIYDFPVVLDFIKNRISTEKNSDIVFVLNTMEVYTKEAENGNIKQEFKGLIPKGHYVYAKESIEKKRTLFYAVPHKIIKLCFDLAKTLGLKVKSIDYHGRVLVDYIKNNEGAETVLLINLKDEITVFSVIKNGVLKLQTTIKNVKKQDLHSSASRIIKYYSDKNSREHVKKIYLYSDEDNNDMAEKISEKMSLQVENIENSGIYKGYEMGELNFGINILDVKNSNWIYSFAVGLIVLVFISLIALPTKDYFYAVSQYKIVQGDFDAIDDIIWIMEEEKAAELRLSDAKIYSDIVNALPDDANNIEINVKPEMVIVRGNYVSEIDEEAIKNINLDINITVDSVLKTFEIEYDAGGGGN